MCIIIMSYKIKSIECQQEYAQKVKKFINESNNLIKQTIKHDVSKYFNTKLNSNCVTDKHTRHLFIFITLMK